MKQRVLQTLNILRNYCQMTPPDKLSSENSQGKAGGENPGAAMGRDTPGSPTGGFYGPEAGKDGSRSSRTGEGGVSLSARKVSTAAKPGLDLSIVVDVEWRFCARSSN